MTTTTSRIKLLLIVFVGIVNVCKIKGEIFETCDKPRETCETKKTCGSWESEISCKNDYVGGKRVERQICTTEIKCTITKIQIHDCEDVRFAIDYREDTIQDVPELSNVNFPATDGISICFWYKVNEYHTSHNAVALYGSPDITGDNDLLITFEGNEVTVFMKSSRLHVFQDFPLKNWTHFCWTWDSSGSWTTYINGVSKRSGNTAESNFKGRFLQTTGFLLLGQDKDSDTTIEEPSQMFIGEITQFYLFHKKLSRKELSSVFKNKGPRENLVVGWWQFKGKAKGGNIVETDYPF